METLLQEAYDAGRREWPALPLDYPSFQAAVVNVGAAPADVADRPGDFFLATACARGLPAALAEFERDYLSRVPRHLNRLRLTPAQVDEVMQNVRIRLLSGSPPRIALYAARAPLDAWVRVMAVRVGLDLLEAEKKGPIAAEDDTLAALVMGGTDPEILASKADVRQAFQQALEESLSALTARDKTVLRMHFLDGLNIDAIGSVFRVHRATVARWLVAIRTQVFGEVRRKLALGRTPTSAEFRSLVRLMGNDLHVSMDRVLRT